MHLKPSKLETENMENEAMKVTRPRVLAEAIDEVERELTVRKRCFPRWVSEGRMSRTDAFDRYDRLAAALSALQIMAGTMPAGDKETPIISPKGY